MKFAVVIEKTPRNYSAYVLDLPGCVATGETLEEVTLNIQGAIELHLEGMRQEGMPIPEPEASTVLVEV